MTILGTYLPKFLSLSQNKISQHKYAILSYLLATKEFPIIRQVFSFQERVGIDVIKITSLYFILMSLNR